MTLRCWLFHRKFHYSWTGGYRGLFGRWVLLPPVRCTVCGEEQQAARVDRGQWP